MDVLKGLMDEYHFPPHLIFNFDETMLDPTSPKLKVISRSGNPRPFATTAGKGEHISLGLCISASGSFLQPLLILPLKTLPPLAEVINNFYAISGSENGFMTKELWLSYLDTTLIPGINNIRQLSGELDAWALVIVDGHNSRDLSEGVQCCRDHKIILACMPAHSSAICQPLDLTVNYIFKVNIRNFFKPQEGESVPEKHNRLLFLSMYALQVAFNAYTIEKGFARAGIFPFSREAPLQSRYIKSAAIPTPPSKPSKGTKRRSISGHVLTTTNTMSGLPPLPAPKRQTPLLKSAPQHRAAILPPATTQVVSINYVVPQ